MERPWLILKTTWLIGILESHLLNGNASFVHGFDGDLYATWVLEREKWMPTILTWFRLQYDLAFNRIVKILIQNEYFGSFCERNIKTKDNEIVQSHYEKALLVHGIMCDFCMCVDQILS